MAGRNADPSGVIDCAWQRLLKVARTIADIDQSDLSHVNICRRQLAIERLTVCSPSAETTDIKKGHFALFINRRIGVVFSTFNLRFTAGKGVKRFGRLIRVIYLDHTRSASVTAHVRHGILLRRVSLPR